MKTGAWSQGGASCKLGYSVVVPAHLRGGLLEITNLVTDEKDRKKGHATALLAKICDNADIDRKILLIMPDPGGQVLDKDELTRWYIRRFGFEVLQDKPVRLLVRRWQNRRILSLRPKSDLSAPRTSMAQHES